jgi:hypothetical protein
MLFALSPPPSVELQWTVSELASEISSCCRRGLAGFSSHFVVHVIILCFQSAILAGLPTLYLISHPVELSDRLVPQLTGPFPEAYC